MPVLVKVLHRRRDIETERHRYLERDTGTKTERKRDRGRNTDL